MDKELIYKKACAVLGVDKKAAIADRAYDTIMKKIAGGNPAMKMVKTQPTISPDAYPSGNTSTVGNLISRLKQNKQI